jgi:hypothetical protein
MRKLILLLAFAFWAWTFSLMLSSDANAQKKGAVVEAQINVNYPVISVIYEEGKDSQGNSLGMADLQVHDRKGQTNDVDFHRMDARARNNDPISPFVKVVFMEDLGGYNFRMTENMEERAREPDGINTLLIHYSKFLPATRVKYPSY